MNSPAALRARADHLGQMLPPLLAQADHLATAVMAGEHGRARAGAGDEFWQYRPAYAGDHSRLIDWRRSARSDGYYVRDHEWQAAQNILLWVDNAASMRFSGDQNRPEKLDHARLLGLALAMLLLRGGERVGLLGTDAPPRAGRAHAAQLAYDMLMTQDHVPDYGAVDLRSLSVRGHLVVMSDFWGDLAQLQGMMQAAAAQGVRGVMLHLLDPVEREFPFDGRTVFRSMAGSVRHETHQAAALRGRYQLKLAERRDDLARMARASGWRMTAHFTDQPAQLALSWLYQALEMGK